MPLTEPQKEYIRSTWTKLAIRLPVEQCKELYFGLDDLIQYGDNALQIAYQAVSSKIK